MPRRVRDVRILPSDAIVEHRPDGTIHVRSPHRLGPYPNRITERLEVWAALAPDRTFLAQRDKNHLWQRLTYAGALRRVRNIAQTLLNRNLSSDRPIAILSGNSIEHALIALAAMYVGIPYAPIAPAYSLLAKEYTTLRFLWHHFRPGLVFASEGSKFEPALKSVMHGDEELVCHLSHPESIRATSLAELESVSATSAVDDAHTLVKADTVAKILYTSGSTGRSKGVITTQRMLCSNQEMMRTVWQFFEDVPPVLCDWFPWNHTFGGSHNFGIALYNGGTLYIDEGKPTPEGFAATIANLRDVATTTYFNVPRGYELLVPALREDRAFREHFFSRLNILFYAAASLKQQTWDDLQNLAVETCGEEILMITGLGATETAPYALGTGKEPAAAGIVGLPAPGLELKLVRNGPKLEACLRGPNITPGYFRDPELTAKVFDDEGFYHMGDALKFVDPNNPSRGFQFEGRINEDFKLSTGTWVSVGTLRAKFLHTFSDIASDVVIAAPERDYVCALVFPNLPVCRALAKDLPSTATPEAVLCDPAVREKFRKSLVELASHSTGSSTRLERILLLEEPPSIDKREITDKGSINQKNVLQHRAALVERLYAEPVADRVITAT